MTRYDKLVRDRIPEIIAAAGKRCDVRVLDEHEYAQRLDEKLAEEVEEYRVTGAVEELVDVVELLRRSPRRAGCRGPTFEQMRRAKREERGGFAGRVLLDQADA